MSVDITAEEFNILQGVLCKHLNDTYKVWVFGSRAKNKARFNSDIDLAIEGKTKIDQKIMIHLKEDFEDAKIAFAVDVVDLNAIEPYFKNIIESQRVPFPMNS